jgi:TonB family protein
MQVAIARYCICLSIFLCLLSQANAIEPVLPVVSSAPIPFYPAAALKAGIEGTVTIRVTTNGERVVTANVESGSPMLSRAAVENIMAWRFEHHKPISFVVTFRYVRSSEKYCGITDNGIITLRLPREVVVEGQRIVMCDPDIELPPKD